MAVVQYQNFCSPGFGLVAPCPFPRLKRFLAKGAAPCWVRCGGPGLQVQPGSGFSGAAAPSRHSAMLSWSPATLAVCPLSVSVCGAVSIPPAGGQPPAGHLHTKNLSGGKPHCRGGSFCFAGEHQGGGNCINSLWEMCGLDMTPGLCMAEPAPGRDSCWCLSAIGKRPLKGSSAQAPSKMSPFLIQIPSPIG